MRIFGISRKKRKKRGNIRNEDFRKDQYCFFVKIQIDIIAYHTKIRNVRI